jgi:hypothetical protein
MWDAIENVTAMVLATYALHTKLIGPEVWGPIVAAASFGAGVLRMAGAKRAGVVSGGVALVIAHYARVIAGVALAFTLLGCANAPPLEQIRTPLNVLGQRMTVLKRCIVADRRHTLYGEPIPSDCVDIDALYNDVAEAQQAAQTGLDVVEAVLQP